MPVSIQHSIQPGIPLHWRSCGHGPMSWGALVVSQIIPSRRSQSNRVLYYLACKCSWSTSSEATPFRYKVLSSRDLYMMLCPNRKATWIQETKTGSRNGPTYHDSPCSWGILCSLFTTPALQCLEVFILKGGKSKKKQHRTHQPMTVARHFGLLVSRNCHMRREPES